MLFFYILQYPHRVKLILAAISPSRSRAKSGAAATLAADFLARASRFLPCEAQAFGSEAALLAWLDRQSARTAPVLILLDSQGRQLSSEDFAAAIGRFRDSGTQSLVLAIGPANGSRLEPSRCPTSSPVSCWPSRSTARSPFSPAIPTTPDTDPRTSSLQP